MKTHIEINRDNLVHNLELFNRLTHKKLMFVVKANAYGHGLQEIISITKDLDFIDYYAVDSVTEALAVRAGDPHKKILILGWSDKEELETVITEGFETVAPSEDFLKTADRLAKKHGRKARVHMKVETGTGRLGMDPARVKKLFNGSALKHIDTIGIYSHFANIEDTTDHSYALYQLGVFNDLLAQLKHPNLLRHFSCSASTLLFPHTYFDMVRVGISAYGYWPSKQTYISYIEQKGGKLDLRPVLSWYTSVAQVKTLKKGDHIGYGITYRTFNKTKLMVVPVGYYDGYDRKLSNISTVVVNGMKAPLRGRVCMDMFMAEVTHIKKVKQGDRVMLIGREGDETITADDLAELSGSINYEILARINPLIPRKVV